MRGALTRRGLAALLGIVTLLVAACGGGSGSSTSASAATANGGILNLGIYQEQTNLLNAGIAANNTFADLIDAPAMEGLLWYRPASATTKTTHSADYWVPDLATKVPSVSNGLVTATKGCDKDAKAVMCVTWPLRSGVTWQDGSTFTSKDVCATYDFWWLKYGANNPSKPVTSNGWSDVVNCNDSSPYTAVVDFGTTYGPYLTLGSGVYGILPASLLNQAFSSGQSIQTMNFTVDLSKGSGNSSAYHGTASMTAFLDGTGPYVFQSYTPGQSYTFVPNKNYWDKSAMPHLSRIVFQVEASQNQELNALATNDVQGTFDLGLSNLHPLQQDKSSGITASTVPMPGAEVLAFNVCGDAAYYVEGRSLCGAGPWSEYTANATIRRAILTALDRQTIVNDIAGGAAAIPPDSYMSLGASWIADPSIPTTSFSVDAANQLLDTAGFKYNQNCSGGKVRAFSDGTCIIIKLTTANDDQANVDAQTLIEGDLAAIGIEVQTPFSDQMPSAFVGSTGLLATHNFDMALITSDMAMPGEPDSYLSWYGGCTDTTYAACTADPNNEIPSTANNGNGLNATGINNAELTNDLIQGHAAATASARQSYYVDAEKVLAQQLPDIPLFQAQAINGFSSRVQNVQINQFVWDFNIGQWWCSGGHCR